MNPAGDEAPGIERLLAERDWVRRLARTLVADDSAADDLAQETWLATATRPPPTGGSPRGWLATVLRRAAWKGRRSATRRAARERAAARPEAVPAAADVVARAELHARVVRAVLDLEEPYRAAVLLRFFEGLPPRAIGERTGVPAETARARVRRGVAMLRERFDRDHAGARAAWVATLAPLAEEPDGSARPPPGVGTGAVAAAVAAVLVLAGAGAWWLTTSREGVDAGSGVPAVAKADDTKPATGGVALTADGARKPAAGGAAGLAPRGGAASDERGSARGTGASSLSGRVTRASDGSPVAGAHVVAVRLDELRNETDTLETTTETDADGRYAFARLAGREVMVLPSARGLAPRGLAEIQPGGFNPLAVEISPAKPMVFDVTMEAGASVVGRVVDAAGAPVAGAEVTALLGEEEVRAGLPVNREWPEGKDPRIPSWSATSGADGAFVVDGVARGATIRIRATSPDQRPTAVRTVRIDAEPTDLGTLAFPKRRWVNVTVLEPGTEAPVAGAEVCVSRPVDRGWGGLEGGSFHTGPDGRVRAGPLPEGPLQISAAKPGGRCMTTSSPGVENLIEGDTATIHVSDQAERSPLREGPHSEIRIRVVGPDGAPILRAWFVAYEIHGGGGGLMAGMVREEVQGVGWGSPRVEWAEVYDATTADGVPLGLGHAVVPVPKEDEFEVRLGPERVIRGRVLDPAGRPLGGAVIAATPVGWASMLRESVHPISQARSDSAGAFTLRGLGDGTYRVVVSTPRAQAAGEAVEVAAGTENAEIRLHERATLRVEVVDGDGAPVVGAAVELRPPVVGDPFAERRMEYEEPVATASSGADGIAELPALDADVPYRLHVTPPARANGLAEVTIDPWRTSESRVCLAPVFTIRGVVRDQDGRPLESASVEIEGTGRRRPRGVETAKDGSFTLKGLTQGWWLVGALDSGGRWPPKGALRVRAGAEAVELVVGSGVELRVEVDNPPKERVTAHLISEDDDREQIQSGWGDPTFRFVGVTPGKTYSFFVSSAEDGLSAFRTGVHGDVGTLRVTRVPGLTISGTVTAPAGATRVSVWLGNTPNPVIRAQSELQGGGRYVLSGLPPGHYVVTAAARVEGTSWRAAGKADAGGTLDLELKAESR